MKKKLATLVTLLMLSAVPAMAQVFIVDDEPNAREESKDFPIIVPIHGVTYDQYAPVGSGAALLIGFGAAYLLAKKRKDN